MFGYRDETVVQVDLFAEPGSIEVSLITPPDPLKLPFGSFGTKDNGSDPAVGRVFWKKSTERGMGFKDAAKSRMIHIIQKVRRVSAIQVLDKSGRRQVVT